MSNKQPQTLTLGQIIELAKEGKQGMLIETPTGYHRIKTVFDNGWMETVEISTPDFKTECTLNHVLVLSDGTQKAAEELRIGDFLQTSKGLQPFISRTPKGIQHVGDVEVDTPDHLIFADGILQHNCISGVMSTCVQCLDMDNALFDVIVEDEGTAPEIEDNRPHLNNY